MGRYVFYDNTTGDIKFVKKFNERQAMINCHANTGVSCIAESELGYVLDHLKVKINLDSMTLEDIPVVVPDPMIELKRYRSMKLQACDWTVGVDSPLSDSKKAEWQTYRQALRDLPSNQSNVSIRTVTWPTKPS
jgi:hypothetical protein